MNFCIPFFVQIKVILETKMEAIIGQILTEQMRNFCTELCKHLEGSPDQPTFETLMQIWNHVAANSTITFTFEEKVKKFATKKRKSGEASGEPSGENGEVSRKRSNDDEESAKAKRATSKKSKVGKVPCPFVLKKGKNIGNPCGKMSVTEFCPKHMLVATPSADEPAAKAMQTESIDDDEDEIGTSLQNVSESDSEEASKIDCSEKEEVNILYFF